MRATVYAVMSVGLICSAMVALAGDPQVVSIGTGGVTGVYYPTGGAICRLVNQGREDHGIRCSVETTGGSVSNINAIQSGEFEFGVAQSDVQANAYRGNAQWAGKPFDKLRSVFSVHPEPVTMLTRKDTGVNGLDQISGKNVNIGNPGSGQRGTWEVMEAEEIVDRKDLAHAAELKATEVGQALCDGKIDAFFWLVGHPSALIQETISTCDAVLVPVTGEKIDKLVAEKPYYRTTKIPAAMYNNDEDVRTFGVGATFVTSSDVPDDVVYVVVKNVFDNFEDFKKRHPAFGNLSEKEMIADSLTAPLHPGAEKYYKERGWM
ncbi:MAG: TAXI family TRAP transporter solute-binding subunit [Stappiaceae bacterium]